MKKCFSLLLFMAFYCSNLNSQNKSTIFLNGKIYVSNEKEIEVILEINLNSDSTNAYMYIPEQFVYKMCASKASYFEDSIFLKFSKLNGYFNLNKTSYNNHYNGIWTQANKKFETEFDFISKQKVSFLERPQTPIPPFEYREQEFEIRNQKADVVLSGTLSIPNNKGNKKFPLIILVSGSGAQDRNEEIAGHKPFWVFADYLTKNGIAVFRYDDRGYGKSTGDNYSATTLDFLSDAISIVKFFENHQEIDKSLIGIAGHSEGALIAVLAAAQYKKDIDFVISLAGPAVSMKDLLYKQAIEINRSLGYPQEDILLLTEMQKKAIQIAVKSKNSTVLRNELKTLYDEYSKYFNKDKIEEYKINQQGLNNAVMQLSNPWMKTFLNIDPKKYIKKISCPILVLNGEKDVQVDADMNITAFQTLLNPQKCKYIKIEKLPGLNHLFQQCNKCTVNEYFMINQTISPQVLELIKDFVIDVQNLNKNNF